MKPVDQTRFGIEEHLTEAPGNCWPACIASILECDLSNVPDEADFWEPGMTHSQSWRLYEPAVHKWLHERGLLLLEVKCSAVFFSGQRFDPLCIMSGPSPRNPEVNHAVVGCGNEIIHDPHPSRAGLVTTDTDKLWYEFFLPRAVLPLSSLLSTLRQQ